MRLSGKVSNLTGFTTSVMVRKCNEEYMRIVRVFVSDDYLR